MDRIRRTVAGDWFSDRRDPGIGAAVWLAVAVILLVILGFISGFAAVTIPVADTPRPAPLDLDAQVIHSVVTRYKEIMDERAASKSGGEALAGSEATPQSRP
jgi:hypothetical protein